MEPWVLERLSSVVGRNDRAALAELVQSNVEKRDSGGLLTYRVRHSQGPLVRGMVVMPEGVIAEYARVRRVFHVANAVTKYYYSPFYVEELVPGYHVRVARIDDGAVALTRDGRVCPFTTDRIGDVVDLSILVERPEIVLCLAVRGATPYLRGDCEGVDLAADLIDLMERDVREPLAPAEKYELAERFDLPVVRHAGPFTTSDLDDLDAWVDERNADGAEGVVLKPSERHHRPLKYGFPKRQLEPLPAWAVLGYGDSRQDDACRARLLRMACGGPQTGRGPGDWDWAAVGRALLGPLARAVTAVAEGGAVREERQVRVHSHEAAEAQAARLSEVADGVSATAIEVEQEESGEWLVSWVYSYDATTEEIERRLSGASFRD